MKTELQSLERDNLEQHLTSICKATSPKSFLEIQEALTSLAWWEPELTLWYGKFLGYTPLGNPNDPPDLILHFEREDLNIEVTSLDPDHIHLADKIHRKIGAKLGRCCPQLSRPPKKKGREKELKAQMYSGYLPAEDTTEAFKVRTETIINRVAEKMNPTKEKSLQNLKGPGIIVLHTSPYSPIGEYEMTPIQDAFSILLKTYPNWGFCTHRNRDFGWMQHPLLPTSNQWDERYRELPPIEPIDTDCSIEEFVEQFLNRKKRSDP